MAHKTLVALATALAAGCGSSKPGTLHLSLTGVKPLTNGFAYEGWAIIGGKPASTGRFNLDAAGVIVSTAGAPVAGGDFSTALDLSAATAVVVTIEPAGKAPGAPSDTHFLAGALANGPASLSVANAAALQDDFTGAKGKYVLAAPTDTGTGHQKSGLWFLDLSGGSPAAGLSLPALPAGWKYEGWAVIGGQPVTTGKFRAASSSDEAATYSGTGSAPPFPGEDFLKNAPAGLTFPTDLSGQMAAITIEPDPDDSPGPFLALKPLAATVATAAVDHQTYALDNHAAEFPTGLATIK